MSVTDLSHAVRHLCHVVDVFYKLLKGFHDFCLFNMSDQIVVGILSSCFWLKNYKNIVLRYSMTSKQYFCVGELLNCLKMVWMHSNGNCTTVRYHTKLYESWQKKCVFRLSLGLSTQNMEFKYKQANKKIETGVLVWKPKNKKSYWSIFFALAAEFLKLNDDFTCLKASPYLNGNYGWDYMQEGRRENCITEVYPV